MARARKVTVTVLENGDLDVDGLGVIDNPLVGRVTLEPIDLGSLWFKLWAEDLHNNPNSGRVKAILLNELNISVGEILSAMREV